MSYAKPENCATNSDKEVKQSTSQILNFLRLLKSSKFKEYTYKKRKRKPCDFLSAMYFYLREICTSAIIYQVMVLRLV